MLKAKGQAHLAHKYVNDKTQTERKSSLFSQVTFEKKKNYQRKKKIELSNETSTCLNIKRKKKRQLYAVEMAKNQVQE